MHARLLVMWPAWKTWQRVVGVPVEPDPLALLPVDRPVPLLLHDPAALLMQFVLLLPLHLDQSKFLLIIAHVINNLLANKWKLEIFIWYSIVNRRRENQKEKKQDSIQCFKY